MRLLHTLKHNSSTYFLILHFADDVKPLVNQQIVQMRTSEELQGLPSSEQGHTTLHAMLSPSGRTTTPQYAHYQQMSPYINGSEALQAAAISANIPMSTTAYNSLPVIGGSMFANASLVHQPVTITEAQPPREVMASPTSSPHHHMSGGSPAQLQTLGTVPHMTYAQSSPAAKAIPVVVEPPTYITAADAQHAHLLEKEKEEEQVVKHEEPQHIHYANSPSQGSPAHYQAAHS